MQAVGASSATGGSVDMDASEAVRSNMQVVPEPDTVQEKAFSDTDRLIDAPCVLAEGLVKYGNKQTVRKLVFALLVGLCFMVVEFCGGYFTHSLALMTDAAHLLSDVTGFAVAAVASHLASRKSATTYSFGYHRAEVLGALMSVLIIWVVTGVLIYEAILRIITPGHTKGKAMFFFALGGVAVNLLNFAILGHAPKLKNAVGGHSHHADINLKGAILQVFGDTIQAIGVAIAAALIWAHQNQEKWQIADPSVRLHLQSLYFAPPFAWCVT
ncbi:TPA: Metal tolerance protein 1, variant 3 [Trebouxia sp. C0006]